MMQHLQPLQPHIPQILRLTIAKFSHTTTAIDHNGPLTWNHVTGHGDLVCIFEKLQDATSTPARLIQRVVRGDVILVPPYHLCRLTTKVLTTVSASTRRMSISQVLFKWRHRGLPRSQMAQWPSFPLRLLSSYLVLQSNILKVEPMCVCSAKESSMGRAF